MANKESIMEDLDVYDHVTKVIAYHPKYFEHYIKTHRYLMYDDGPLPFTWRHYLAIMAATRNKCNYLVSLHEKEFLDEGGNASWLKGLEFIPQVSSYLNLNKQYVKRNYSFRNFVPYMTLTKFLHIDVG